MNEVENKREADPLVEPGLLGELGVQVETLNTGLQVDEDILMEAESTIDRGLGAE